MSKQYSQSFQQKIQSIIAQLPKGSGPLADAFLRQFFAKTTLVDLESLDPAVGCKTALSALEFMQQRTPGEPKIRVETPDKDSYSWKTRRAVVEILNDDMPFLVDSISNELMRLGFKLHTVYHPILQVARDASGKLAALEGKAANNESFMRFEISPLPESLTAEQLLQDIAYVLSAVRHVYSDWPQMLAKMDEAIARLHQTPKSFNAEEVQEARAFLEWLRDKNFIFLGHIEYNFFDAKGHEQLSVTPGSELGIFKIADNDLKPQGLKALPPEMLNFARTPQLVEITKSIRKSTVHRAVPMDYIGIKRFDGKGNVIGESRILGLFTSIVYYQTTDDIPIIRHKAARTLERAGFAAQSHDQKALKAILEFFPRDELFQIGEDDLFETALGILSLEMRPGVRLFVRKDIFERFISCMVYVPRERFSTYLREHIQSILEHAFNGTVTAFNTQISEAALARLHLTLRTTPGQIPAADIAEIEATIAATTTHWNDVLQEALIQRFGETRGEDLYRIYGNSFPRAYMNSLLPDNAVYDISKIEDAIRSHALSVELFQLKGDSDSTLHLKIYSPGQHLPLSDILPMLENMGFRVIDEYPFQIMPLNGAVKEVWIRDFNLQMKELRVAEFAKLKPLFEEALLKVWSGSMENDGFNALVLHAGLNWRQVTLIRAYAKYLKQINFAYSQAVIEQTLNRHPQIAHFLIDLFEARFNPVESARDQKTEKVLAEIDQLLQVVDNLADDRILRRIADVIQATLRTNFYQMENKDTPKSYLSFKFNSAKVPELPLPHPYAEIFVYAMRFEGIHLRGGRVARGGLRWSDRPEDFRTEVLGLMKAQMVKNSVIVPVGSKGGFVLKQPPAAGNREALMEEGIACYKTYLRGLLDLTDNIIDGKIVAPPFLVRHDGDDPYLVVAADKGTASFSDYANSVSADYHFWLGDAFASGGSVGYDHKKMGITARGGWISVERHFREMGLDIEKNDFTVTGIGDMSGDVFGNAMLLSKHIKLIAAFNHVHIFLDPSPDAAKSFAERQRLFDLPRSGWKDYNPSLISKGGGIYERSAKSIAITPEVKALLGITKASLSPDELIRAILAAQVDLLWNGGIGTYVKATEESHEDVGDRTNNTLRLNGSELRCKVVGEGGNLGFTQRGRVEYALTGGRINTDAIDNSAGVDCSDHEVNIKIALGPAVASGKLPLEKRDALLATMTDEVARLVLKDNYLQTQAITIAESQGLSLLESQARFMTSLESRGLLNRAIEFLPDQKIIADRRGMKKGLTRPELAVLLAYSKITLYNEILNSTLPDEPHFLDDLIRYFPVQMQDSFKSEIEQHRLRREIVATVLTNSMVNRAGITFFHDIGQDTGLPAADVARAYTIARDLFGLRELWYAIQELDGKVAVGVQVEMFTAVTRFVEQVTRWFLHNVAHPIDIGKIMQDYAPAIRELSEAMSSLLSPHMRQGFDERRKHFTDQGVTEAIASRIAGFDALLSSGDIVKVAQDAKISASDAARRYFELGARLQLGWLRGSANKVAGEGYWNRLAVLSIVNDLYGQQRRLTASALSYPTQEKWLEAHQQEIDRYDHFMDDLRKSGTLDFPMLTVAQRNVQLLGSV